MFLIIARIPKERTSPLKSKSSILSLLINFPLDSIPFLLPIYLVISTKYILYFFVVFGFVISYHILSTIQEFSYNQPDIYLTGKIFSTIFLIFANILVYGFVFMFVNGGLEMGWDFLKQGVNNTLLLIITYKINYFG